MTMGALCTRVAATCERISGLLPEGPHREVVTRVRDGLDQPLRVAVAGRVNSGKSTLVNALLRQRVAPTDVSECTRYVTSYRHGVPERLVVVGRDGTRHDHALLPDGSLPRSPGEGAGPIARLEVFLANDSLRDLVLIDTPGLGSLNEEYSAETVALLGLDGDSQAAVAEADALVFVLTPSLRGDGVDVLRGFREVLVGSTASSLSTVCVLSKADLVDDGADPLVAATELSARYAQALRDVVTGVWPVMSLLAETADTGRFTEGHAVGLRALAALPGSVQRSLLLGVDRFRTAEAPIAPADRADLVDALGMHGIAHCLELIQAGTSTAADLLPSLRDRSGISGLRLLLLERYARDADALKASGALAALERLSYAMVEPELAGLRIELHDEIDAVRVDPAMHRLAELRALDEVSSGLVVLPEPLDEELRRLTGGGGPAERLGLPPAARPDELQRAAASAAAAWKRFRNDGRSTPGQQWVADVMSQSCERLWLDAGRAAAPEPAP
jgi:hypothetical protein